MIDTTKLRKALERKMMLEGFTKQGLAEDMGVTPATLSKYILDGAIPNHRIKKVCDYAGIKVVDVLPKEEK